MCVGVRHAGREPPPPKHVAYLDQVLSKGAAINDSGLGTADLGCSHQLHGIRDLLGVLDRCNSA